MKLCRFKNKFEQIGIGMLLDDSILLDLTAAGVGEMTPLLESKDPLKQLSDFTKLNLPRLDLSEVTLLSPIERQEVWAAGVTYLRSKKARMEESEFSATAYDRVYEAERPEIFFKSLPEKTAGPGEPVGIRKDAKWNVPEPELVLIINSSRQLVGFSIGNDMSSRDIEGENLLYLPQAKVYERSCAIGPCIVLGQNESGAREWAIHLEIHRHGQLAFEGETSVANIKRTFDELIGFLCRSQQFPSGAALLTGTGIVPPDTFTLAAGDKIRIHISGIGTLENHVIEV